MPASANTIREHLDAVLRYLKPYMRFVNCHMVEYLNHELWNEHIPVGIRNEIQTVADADEAIAHFWAFFNAPQSCENHNRFTSMTEFLRAGQLHRLADLPADILWEPHLLRNELIDRGILGRFPEGEVGGLKIKEFMNEKKTHEVEIAANMVAALCSTTGTAQPKHCVIDAGDGKGYLSSRLALEYELNVLGIDANEGNTQGAFKRSAKLEVRMLHYMSKTPGA